MQLPKFSLVTTRLIIYYLDRLSEVISVVSDNVSGVVVRVSFVLRSFLKVSLSSNMASSSEDVKSKGSGQHFDINGPHFNPDLYLQKLTKENSLKDIIEEEERIVRDTQSLHSEMQTLVYENYNKFISATDTIKKMKTDFKQMETEMDLLATNMNSITSFSDQISSTLQDTRQQISKLSSIHSLLKKLQFLYKLPSKLKQLIQERNYSQAVNDYLHTQQVLNHYAHLESFHGIQKDCLQIVQDLKDELRGQFKKKETSAKDVTTSVELLLKLGEPADSLYSEIITHATNRLLDQLDFIKLDSTGQDLIEFVDIINNGYLGDLCLFVSSYNDMFAANIDQNESAKEVVDRFVEVRMTELLDCVEARFVKEVKGHADSGIIVRALDRLHSRLTNLANIFTRLDLHSKSLNFVIRVVEKECLSQLQLLESHVSDWIRTVRQSVAQSVQGKSQTDTAELLTSLVLTTVEKTKGVLHDLTMFISRELSFCSVDGIFVKKFSLECVYQSLVVEFLKRLVALALSFTKASSPPSPPTILVLAKMCLEFEVSHVNYLLNLVTEWFGIKDTKRVTKDKEEICKRMHEAGQSLVDYYVKMQSSVISEMLRKSVETRDWLHCLEPRTGPRSVIKRVLEELNSSDSTVSRLFDTMAPPAPSSDSSRHRQSIHHSRAWSTHSQRINRIFSEKIDVFSPVQLDKSSIITGIIKISLKTLLECVRLKTFNKFGLQQMQVDTHYLQLHLWKYIADENIVHLLLDEILGSAVHRCLNPVLMEPSVVEILCERG